MRDIKVGAAVLVGIGIAVALVLALEGRHLMPGIQIHVEMERVGALQEGDPVRMAGLELGDIDHIRLEHDHAILDLWIRKKHAWLLRETSEFFVNQPGIIGEPYLEVGQRPDVEPGPPLADGATVHGVAPPRLDRLLATGYENLRSFMELVHDGLPEWNALTTQIDALGHTLDEIQPAPGALAKAWIAARRAFHEAELLGDTVGQIDVDPRAVRDRTTLFLAEARGKLSVAQHKLAALSAAADALGRAMSDPRVARFAEAIDRARALTERVQRTIAATQAIVAWIDSGRGTIGAFLHDEALADEMKEMSKILKRRPWEALGHPQDRRQAAP